MLNISTEQTAKIYWSPINEQILFQVEMLKNIALRFGLTLRLNALCSVYIAIHWNSMCMHYSSHHQKKTFQHELY